ncbi:MAG TPA: hypothetical protein VE669_02900 [Actinomycetota bacterium]|nr:hypothetical protein [Actinomycetota bacterium]
MRRGGPGIPATALVATLLLAACREAASDEHVIDDPATIEQVEGSDTPRITLTPRAADRLGIETGRVVDDGEGPVVPSAAVMVDPEGAFWVYTSPEPLVFLRQEVTVEHQDAGVTYLSNGPPAGTEVVTVGVPELYGAETGIGH